MTRSLRSLPVLLGLVAFAPHPLVGQTRVTPLPNAVLYEIAFPNAVHREAEVSVVFRAVPAGSLRIRMARSSPGRYALHEFAKNVYEVRATDAARRPIPVVRVSPYEWEVTGHLGEVRFHYTLYADRADGTYAGVDGTRAHLNLPAVFAWAPALAARPIQATFIPSDTAWRIATQLEPTRDPRVFRAPNLQYFLDSPVHIGPIDVRQWQVESGGRTQTIRLAVNHTGTADEVTAYTDLTKRVVAEMAAVFGELPRFDFGTYTFIACYRSSCAGDGMEHRNSTSLTSGSSLASASTNLLGTVSHEFFHAWNVERIRPASLEPFDFSAANMSGELWLAEGFTNYYGPLVIARAGITTPSQYASRLSGAVNALTTSPARALTPTGAVGMSQQATFVDAAVSIDPTNRPNTFISYYTYGEALGLALDLTLRARPTPATLDDFMREMWTRHGKDQSAALAPVKPYTLADAESALAAVANDPAFARDFFARFVAGNALPDYPALLRRAGFHVRLAQPTQTWMGDTFISARDGEVIVAGPTTRGTPMHELGLSPGDRILTIDGATIGTNEELRAAIGAKKSGDAVLVTWRGRTGDLSGTMTLRGNPRVEVVAFEDAEMTPSAEQLAFRAAWLGSRQR